MKLYLGIHWLKDYYGVATLQNNLIMQWTYDGSQIIHVIIADYVKKELLYVTNEDLSQLQHRAIVDIGYDGERWEGDVLNGNPIGWGRYYDYNNNKVYEGFMYVMEPNIMVIYIQLSIVVCFIIICDLVKVVNMIVVITFCMMVNGEKINIWKLK